MLDINKIKTIKDLKESGYMNIEVVQVSISKGEDIGTLTMMKGQNPIFIITGDKR